MLEWRKVSLLKLFATRANVNISRGNTSASKVGFH